MIELTRFQIILTVYIIGVIAAFFVTRWDRRKSFSTQTWSNIIIASFFSLFSWVAIIFFIPEILSGIKFKDPPKWL